MRLKSVIRLFEDGNVSVSGLRGRGKDMLTANVVVRRKKPYISNINYGGEWYPLEFDKLNIGENTCFDFIDGNVKYYEWPYPLGCDVYGSDLSVYLPSHEVKDLNKRYPYLATAMCLSRHVGEYNFHFNSQRLHRVWDKVREQSDTYIVCMKCVVILGFVFQRIRTYTDYDAADRQVPPYPVKKPMFGRDRRLAWQLDYAKYVTSHGEIKSKLLIYRNRSQYDTHHFRRVLREGYVK